MKTKPDSTQRLAGEIQATEEKLHDLEKEIREIGEPAAIALRDRLHALEVEEHALQRNFAEAQSAEAGTPKKRRLRKVEKLLHHIEHEEAALQHDADFLHQASPTTLELAFRGAARILDPAARKLKQAKGGRQWFWHSPFVNHTHDNLARDYKMPPSDE